MNVRKFLTRSVSNQIQINFPTFFKIRNFAPFTTQTHPQTSVASLFDFTPNKFNITSKLALINPLDEGCKNLLQAIKFGNYDADIFQDADCSYFLLKLMEAGIIPFEEGITVYVYLMALMQFSDLQPVAEHDAYLKCDKAYSIERLVENNRLTPAALMYIDVICENFATFEITINQFALKKFMMNLPPAEQWLLQLGYNPNSIGIDYDVAIKTVSYLAPFLPTIADYLFLPSTRVINFIIQQMSDKPVLLRPIFGTIQSENFLALRQSGFHPCALYHPKMPDNLVTFHGLRAGLVTAYLHDLTHISTSNLFIPAARDVIYQIYIPVLQELKARAAHANMVGIVDNLDITISSMAEFNITKLEKFLPPKRRLTEYLKYPNQIIHEACAQLKIRAEDVFSEVSGQAPTVSCSPKRGG